jgi:hypothetical protein
VTDPVDYHQRLRNLANDETQMGHGFGQPMTIIRQSDLKGAVAEHENSVAELSRALDNNRWLETEVQRLGDLVEELRTRLRIEQGDVVTFEFHGNAVLPDAEVDKIIDRLRQRLCVTEEEPPLYHSGDLQDEDEDDD